MSAYHNLDFASVQVRDLKKARAFYTVVLGFEPTGDERPDAVVFRNDSGGIFAIRTPLRPLPKQGPLGIGASFWFGINDIESLHERIINNEGKVITAPEDGPFGRQMLVADPDGYTLVFHQIAAG